MTALDLSDNQIVPDDRFFDLLQQVKCLYLSGNPMVRDIKHYRRTLVGRLANLMYLDQRAVDSEERLLAESWIREGELGFKSAREQILALRRQRKE
jgi:dynein assembly factor 1